MEEIIKNKLAFSIKKYNSQTRKTNFIDDLNLIKSQNIIYEVENFYVDFEMENDAKIDVGLAKFNKIYNRKPSSISNENLLFTFSVLDESFFNKIDVNAFCNKIYNIMNKYFDILCFIVTKDAVDDLTFYFLTTTVVKKIFLNHIQERVIASGKTLEEMEGILSYNLLLGGTKGEYPEKKFIELILSELNYDESYNLQAASETEKMNYLIKTFDRASLKIIGMQEEFNILVNEFIKKDARYKDVFINIIKQKNLKNISIK